MKTTIGDILDSTFSGEWGNEARDGGTQVLRTTNFNDDGSLDYANPAFRAVSEEVIKKKQLQRGDILLEKSGGTPKKPVGKLAFFDSEGTFLCSNFNQVMRPNRSVAVPKYLYYLLLNLYQNGVFYRYTRKTTGLQNIQIKALLKHFIDLPNTTVQREQTSILGTIDDLSCSLALMTTLCEQLVKSRFIEMFGDPILNCSNFPRRPWGEVLTIRNGKNQTAVEHADGPYPICGSGGEIGRATSYITSQNSVIIGRKGNINNPILMRVPFWNVDTAFGLEPDEQHITVEYLYEYCQFFDFRKLNKAVTIPSLTKADLLKIKMPIPSIDAQRSFSKFVQQVDKLRFDALSLKGFSLCVVY